MFVQKCLNYISPWTVKKYGQRMHLTTYLQLCGNVRNVSQHTFTSACIFLTMQKNLFLLFRVAKLKNVPCTCEITYESQLKNGHYVLFLFCFENIWAKFWYKYIGHILFYKLCKINLIKCRSY